MLYHDRLLSPVSNNDACCYSIKVLFTRKKGKKRKKNKEGSHGIREKENITSVVNASSYLFKENPREL